MKNYHTLITYADENGRVIKAKKSFKSFNKVTANIYAFFKGWFGEVYEG